MVSCDIIIDLFSFGPRWIHNLLCVTVRDFNENPLFVRVKTIERQICHRIVLVVFFGKIRWVFWWKQWPFEITWVFYWQNSFAFRQWMGYNNRGDVHHLHIVSPYLRVSLATLASKQHILFFKLSLSFYVCVRQMNFESDEFQRCLVFFFYFFRFQTELMRKKVRAPRCSHLHRSIFDKSVRLWLH